ncbi:MAG: glycosyltransferase family 39 protein [Actinomycetota bacterium]
MHKFDKTRLILIIAVLLGILLRINAWRESTKVSVLTQSTDSVMYNTLAKNLLNGKGYVGCDHMIAREGKPTAFYAPTYPLYLAFIYGLFGPSERVALISQILIALATVLLVYFLAKHAYGKMEGSIAALIFACVPQIIHYNYLLISETLYMFLELSLLILAVTILNKERPTVFSMVITGFLFGVTYLCRQAIVTFPIVFLPIFWFLHKGSAVKRLAKYTIIFSIAAVLVITPWAVRNYMVFGVPIIGATTGPATLWWGTIESKGKELGILVDRYREKYANKNEYQLSQMMVRDAEKNLQRMSYRKKLGLFWLRFKELFGMPERLDLRSSQTLCSFSYVILALLGTIGLFISSRVRHDRLLLGLIVLLTMVIYILTLGVFRYLMPLVPLLIVGFVGLLSRIASALITLIRANSDGLTEP